MSDIVARLRKRTMPEDVNRLWSERDEAAATIEKLRTRVEELESDSSKALADIVSQSQHRRGKPVE
jgi:hypothetical protein